ncbi:hypothetical protein WJX74_005158 [Apatococcus lobatus]|uniref:Uncharacterized protein n=1 Tax=Apatococcus lobatus TaxID=904363 RepID=A0AAW1QVL5_9CHLO
MPLPTIPEGLDDESYGDGMDMDTLLDEMGLGDDDGPPTPPRFLQNHAMLAVPPRHKANPKAAQQSPQQGVAGVKPTARTPLQEHALDPAGDAVVENGQATFRKLTGLKGPQRPPSVVHRRSDTIEDLDAQLFGSPSRDQKHATDDPAAAKAQPNPVSRPSGSITQPGLAGGVLQSHKTHSAHHQHAPLSPEPQSIEDGRDDRFSAYPARQHSADNAPLASQHQSTSQLPPRFQSSIAGRPSFAQPSFVPFSGQVRPQLLHTTTRSATVDPAKLIHAIYPSQPDGDTASSIQELQDQYNVELETLRTQLADTQQEFAAHARLAHVELANELQEERKEHATAHAALKAQAEKAQQESWSGKQALLAHHLQRSEAEALNHGPCHGFRGSAVPWYQQYMCMAQEASQRELEAIQRMLETAQRAQIIAREEHGRERSRWIAEDLQQRQRMAEDAASAGRAADAARTEELTVRQQLVQLRAHASRAQVEVDMLEEQLQQLRCQARDAKAVAEADADRLEADSRRIAREAQQLLDLGADVQQKSEEVAKAHARNKATSDGLQAQASDLSAQRDDVADALRQLDHKHDRLHEERVLWEEERAQLIRERGHWAEQRGAALAAAEQAATLQAALASQMGNAPLLKVPAWQSLPMLQLMSTHSVTPHKPSYQDNHHQQPPRPGDQPARANPGEAAVHGSTIPEPAASLGTVQIPEQSSRTAQQEAAECLFPDSVEPIIPERPAPHTYLEGQRKFLTSLRSSQGQELLMLSWSAVRGLHAADIKTLKTFRTRQQHSKHLTG